MIMWELRVPWKEYTEEAHEWKFKYDKLLRHAKITGGRQAVCQQRLVQGNSLQGCYARSEIGLVGARKRKVIETIIKTAERTAKWLWLKRSSSWPTR